MISLSDANEKLLTMRWDADPISNIRTCGTRLINEAD